MITINKKHIFVTILLVILGVGVYFFTKFQIAIYNAVVISQGQDVLTATFIQETMPEQYKAWQEKHQLQANEAKK